MPRSAPDRPQDKGLRITIRLLLGAYAPHNKRMKSMLTSASKLAFVRTTYPQPVQGVARVLLVRRVLLGSAPPPVQDACGCRFSGTYHVSSWRTAAGTHGRLLAIRVDLGRSLSAAALVGEVDLPVPAAERRAVPRRTLPNQFGRHRCPYP